MKNHFTFFKLSPAFNIDTVVLKQNYRAIQSESHPDRFVSATPAEKLQSMQLATLANEAYQILKKPSSRAQYILQLQGIDATQETNTSMPADFLMQQMEWREALEDLKAEKNIDGLESLLDEMRQEAQSLTGELSTSIDEKNDLVAATDTTRKLIFIDKVCADIIKAIEWLES
ncbi:MAG: Fe-S protein assembly co-chaperone HscB [Methylophilaceae bacterium]